MTVKSLVVALALVTVTPAAPLSAQALDPRAVADALSKAFADAAAEIGPAVVSITITEKRTAVMTPLESPTPINSPAGAGIDLVPPPAGLGSGVLIDNEGTILTNAHVVGDAEEFSVKTSSGSVLRGRLVRKATDYDLALIKVDHPDPHPAQLGNSDRLQLGEWVVAVGSPFGLENTITAGIVSAKARGIGFGPKVNLIQTDTAINPGNSGGPLVNLSGEVIGINTAIFSRTGGHMGIGFAIPINFIKATFGLGGASQPSSLSLLEDQLGAELRIEQLPNGAVLVVESCSASGVAALAGIRKGDRITAVDDAIPADTDGWLSALSSPKLGAGVRLRLVRDGKSQGILLRVSRSS